MPAGGQTGTEIDERDAWLAGRVLPDMSQAPWQPFAAAPPALLTLFLADADRLPLDHTTWRTFPETRVWENTEGTIGGGVAVSSELPPASLMQQLGSPVEIEGWWLPARLGEWLADDTTAAQAFQRKNAAGEDEILLLVHPASAQLFASLKEQITERITLQALASSSLRTMLVALPHDDQTNYALVKLSLDVSLRSRSRVVSRREAIISVAHSQLAESRLAGIPHLNWMPEPVAFVLALPAAQPETPEAGQIWRRLPEQQAHLHTAEGIRWLPFYALHGLRNEDLLTQIIHCSGQMPGHFISRSILQPLAELVVEALYFRGVSMEMHAQNLLLCIDRKLVIHGFALRDMAGVSMEINAGEWQQLPEKLRNPHDYYLDRHLNDAAVTLEDHLVGRCLFNLTKQFVKLDFQQHDPDFAAWLAQHQPHLRNWTLPGECSDAHRLILREDEYWRYGYIEIRFAHILLAELERRNIFKLIAATDLAVFANWLQQQSLSRPFQNMTGTQMPGADHFRTVLEQPLPGEASPCLRREWFYELVLMTYGGMLFNQRRAC